jgi:hypothetical protein
MINNLLDFFFSLCNRRVVRLAIVRRYADANGSYVGELYAERKGKNFTGYEMIGASLDTLPFDIQNETDVFALDTRNDFLKPMPPMTIRVGALNPKDNDDVRTTVRKLRRRGMILMIQNGFIEHVLANKI